MKLIIGSRGSDLALYQANLIKNRLENEGFEATIKIIKTEGDRIDYLSFEQMEGKSFFTKELEDALLAREIDLAVHSLKDLSTQIPEGLKVGAFCNPEDASELLLIRPEAFDPNERLFIRPEATIGTSSVRRQAQIAFIRPDLKIESLRGNIPTRVRKLRERNYDAILIARAGVERLRLDTSDLKAIVLNRFEFLPAPGQGILALEIRDNDSEVYDAVKRLNDTLAEQTARLERGLLARFQGGCQLPLAVASATRNGGFYIKAFLGKKRDTGWNRPAEFSAFGVDIDGLIERAYIALSSGERAAPADEKRKILITRSEDEGSEFFDSFCDRAKIIYYPVFQVISNVAESGDHSILKRLSEFQWIIFTSRNTVRYFDELLKKLRMRWHSALRVAAVGAKTAAAIEKLGWPVSFVPEREDSEGLLSELPKLFGHQAQKIILPQGAEAPDRLEEGLRASGHQVERVNIYRTIPTGAAHLPAINPAQIDFYIFTSPLSVQFYKRLGNSIPDRAWVASIGDPTAEELARQFRPPNYIPAKADLADIAGKIRELL